MLTHRIDNAGIPQGIVLDGDGRIFVYAVYSPELYAPEHPNVYTFRGAYTRPHSTRLAWSEPVRQLPIAPVRTIGNLVYVVDQHTNRYIVEPEPRTRIMSGVSVGTFNPVGHGHGWAINTSYLQPSSASFACGPRGGLKVRPSLDGFAQMSRSDFRLAYEPITELHIYGWPMAEPTHSKLCQDDKLYVVNRNDRAAVTNLHVFARGRTSGDGCTLTDLSHSTHVTDLDVSPSGRQMALATYTVTSVDPDSQDVREVRRELRLYDVSDPTNVKFSRSYTWSPHLVSYSPDGLTLAMASVSGTAPYDPVDDFVIVDVEE